MTCFPQHLCTARRHDGPSADGARGAGDGHQPGAAGAAPRQPGCGQLPPTAPRAGEDADEQRHPVSGGGGLVSGGQRDGEVWSVRWADGTGRLVSQWRGHGGGCEG